MTKDSPAADYLRRMAADRGVEIDEARLAELEAYIHDGIPMGPGMTIHWDGGATIKVGPTPDDVKHYTRFVTEFGSKLSELMVEYRSQP